MRLTVYSAIYGGYDRPKSAFPVGEKCVLFTDDRYLKAPGWEVRYEPLDWISTPMLRAKWWKTHPELAVPDTDVSVWIDGSLAPGPIFGSRCRDALGKMDVAFTPHPLRTCIYTECDASMGLPKYDAARMLQQVGYYRKMGHPENWGLFASGAMTRRHNNRVEQFNHEWWQHNITWTWQDQLSLPYVLRTHPEILWDTTMPWAAWWGHVEHGV